MYVSMKDEKSKWSEFILQKVWEVRTLALIRDICKS